MRKYHVYIMTNRKNTVLYTGVTGDIARRMFEHKNKPLDGFTKRYNVTKLIYTGEYSSPLEAMAREKQIKAGSRAKKLALIVKSNPGFNDLKIL